MTNPVPPRQPQGPRQPQPGVARQPGAPQPPKRQVALPSGGQRRGGVRGWLLLLGLAMVVGSGLGFWYVLDSVDQRQGYLMTTRTIKRWEVATVGDFTAVEANLGNALGVPVEFVDLLVGKWATGRIPAGTVVTPGMFRTPPLSGEDEVDKVLIEVGLPAGEAPFGTLEEGDRLALFGAEPSELSELSELDGQASSVRLLGVLIVEDVEKGQLFYTVTPEQAKAIESLVDRYTASADRRIWKLGFDITEDDLLDLYGAPAGTPGVGDGFSGDDLFSGGDSNLEMLEEQ